MKLNTTTSVSIAFLLLSGLSQSGAPVPFKATFHGFAEAPVPIEDQIIKVVVPLHGTGTHIGKFDEELTHYIDMSTGAFTGEAHWTAANGDTFTTQFAGQLYPTDNPPWLTFQVTHHVAGGTGRFAGATGTFEGVNGLFNPETGEDQGGYVGTISY